MSAEHAGTRKWKAKHSKGVDVKVASFMLEIAVYTIFHHSLVPTPFYLGFHILELI